VKVKRGPFLVEHTVWTVRECVVASSFEPRRSAAKTIAHVPLTAPEGRETDGSELELQMVDVLPPQAKVVCEIHGAHSVSRKCGRDP
jgi:hypothetical protein